MPTIDARDLQRARPAVTPGFQLPAGAFQAEIQAERRSEAQFIALAGDIAGLADKIRLADQAHQIEVGKSEMETFLDDSALERLKDTDFAGHRQKFDSNFDQWSAQQLEAVKSDTARGVLGQYFATQKSAQGTRIEAEAFMRLAREDKAGVPQMIQQNVDAGFEDEKGAEKEWSETMARRKAAGFVHETGPFSEEGLNRTRAMMKVQTAAQRFPEAAVEMLKTEGGLLNILTEDEIKLLDSADMAALKKDAERQLASQSADIASINKEAVNQAVNEHNKEMFAEVTTSELRDKIRLDPRLDAWPDERQKLLDQFDENVREKNKNAERIATPNDTISAEAAFNEAVRNRDQEKAMKLLSKNAWMFTPAKNSSMLNKVEGEKDLPVNQSLTYYTQSADAILSAQVRTMDPKKGGFVEAVRDSEMKTNDIKMKMDAIAADGSLSEAQKIEEYKKILKPAQDEAARSFFEGFRRLFFTTGGIRDVGRFVTGRGPTPKETEVTVTTRAERDALAPGTRYKDSQGRIAIR